MNRRESATLRPLKGSAMTKTRPLKERFDDSWTPEPNTGCWLWLHRLDYKGHGRFKIAPIGFQAHRIAWTIYRGPIPDGMVIDHVCRVRCCVNPDHLRVVTPRQNSLENNIGPSAINARKTRCKYGHPFDAANTQIIGGRKRLDGTKAPVRICRTCNRTRQADRQRRVAAQEPR